MVRFLPLSLFVAMAVCVTGQQAEPPRPTAKAAKKLSVVPPAVRAEIDRLASDDAGKRATGAASLGEMGDEAIPAIPYLVGALGDTRAVIGPGGRQQVAEVALATLAKLGEPARLALLDALKAGGERDLDQVMWALGRMKEPRAFDPLVRWLADAHWGEYAARTLGDLGDARAVDSLILALKNKNAGAARALGKLKDPRAVEPLIAALGYSGGFLGSDASSALREITGQRLSNAEQWKNWWEMNKERYKKD